MKRRPPREDVRGGVQKCRLGGGEVGMVEEPPALEVDDADPFAFAARTIPRELRVDAANHRPAVDLGAA